MRTLLNVPDVVEIIQPLISQAITTEHIFQLIGNWQVKPFGFVHRAPIFTPDQVASVIEAVAKPTEVPGGTRVRNRSLVMED